MDFSHLVETRLQWQDQHNLKPPMAISMSKTAIYNDSLFFILPHHKSLRVSKFLLSPLFFIVQIFFGVFKMSNLGIKWSADEKVQLCTSWATITSCGANGNDQDVKKLWRNIHVKKI